MSYYFILIIYYLLGYFLCKRNAPEKLKKYYTFLALLPAFILVAFRGVYVGNDTYNYYYAFEKYRQYTSLSQIVRVSIREPGFILLNFLCQKGGRSYFFMQVLIGAFTYFSLYKFISRYSENVWLSCILFLLNRHMFGTMNTMRMWLAIAILLFAVPYLLQRRIIPVILITIGAMTFHFSAIVFLILYFLVGIHWNTKSILLSLCVAIGILFVERPFFRLITRVLNKYSSYLDGRYFDSGGLATYIGLMIQICFFAFVYFEYKKWNHNYETVDMDATELKMKKTYEGLLISGMLVMLLLDIIGLNNTIMSRISAYFAPIAYLAIPYSLRTSSKNNRLILSFLIIALLLVHFIIVMIYRPGWYGVSQYMFFWNE